MAKDTDYSNEMRGVLFENNKRSSDKSPDFTGNCEIDGNKYKIAAWFKEASQGKKDFYSLKFEPVDEEASGKGKPASSSSAPNASTARGPAANKASQGVTNGYAKAKSGNTSGSPDFDMSDDIPF